MRNVCKFTFAAPGLPPVVLDGGEFSPPPVYTALDVFPKANRGIIYPYPRGALVVTPTIAFEPMNGISGLNASAGNVPVATSAPPRTAK